MIVLAHFENGNPAIVADRNRRAAIFTSDLLPHWGLNFEGRAGLLRFIRALVEHVTG